MEFSGNLEKLSDIQMEFLKSILISRGFSECKVNVKPVGEKGDNNTSSVVRITTEDKDGKSFTMIVKIAPTQEIGRQMANTVIFFGNEVIMYNEVLPKLDELQKSAGVPERELFRYPICYGAIEDAPNELIALEDLKEDNFDILNRMVSLTNEEIKMALDRLATLHSLSFLLKTKEPVLYNKFNCGLIDMWSVLGEREETIAGFQSIESSILELMSEDKRELVKGSVTSIPLIAASFHKNDTNSKYSVILQGDCWTNNIMFKLEEGIPVDCVMIDYQISRASSPVVDILYLIFNCTDRETRSKYYYDWIDHYYNKLKGSLSTFGLSANIIYSKDRFDEDLKRYGKFAFGLSLVLAMILTRESDETIPFTDLNEKDIENNDGSLNFLGTKDVKEATMAKLKQKVGDLYESFVQYGYI